MGMLIAHLHSNPMDKEPPLWKYHAAESGLFISP